MKERHLRRLIIGIIVGVLHIAALFLVVFNGGASAGPVTDAGAAVFKLTDISEAPPPPPPPKVEPVVVQKSVEEPVAENIVETEAPVETTEQSAPQTPNTGFSTGDNENYLPQSQISVLPKFNDKEILSHLEYPAIARRSGIEGVVVLELFINRLGYVTRVRVLKETPAGHGFAESAVKAFTGLRAVPAQANGVNVAVRYRYPVRFQLR